MDCEWLYCQAHNRRRNQMFLQRIPKQKNLSTLRSGRADAHAQIAQWTFVWVISGVNPGEMTVILGRLTPQSSNHLRQTVWA